MRPARILHPYGLSDIDSQRNDNVYTVNFNIVLFPLSKSFIQFIIALNRFISFSQIISLLSKKHTRKTCGRVNFITPIKFTLIETDIQLGNQSSEKSSAIVLMQCTCHKTIKRHLSVDTSGGNFRYYAIPTVGIELIAITREVHVKTRNKRAKRSLGRSPEEKVKGHTKHQGSSNFYKKTFNISLYYSI